MHAYRVLGGCLRTELDFPELAVAEPGSATRWSFFIRQGTPLEAALVRLGTDPVRDAGEVRLDRSQGGYRLTYPDTGVYDILSDGATIEWYPPAAPSYEPGRFLEAVRIDVLGRVLATAMHAGGIESLHGSGVALDDGRGIAFVAPKFHGKSTLASAMVARGARLITDDTLPVELGQPPRVRPGVHSVRMWADTAKHLTERLAGLEMGPWGKLQTSRIPEERLVHEIVPLAAVYVLAPHPAADDGAPPVQRGLLSGVEAAVSLVAQAKIGPLLGGAEAPGLLQWAGRLASATPVYRLELARDLRRLPEVADQLFAWHDVPNRVSANGVGT